ncbi:uncharacterized protein LOC128317982 isoform X2 [Pangasianodon hypophthalmus]|uniref:uncharacterized protein LOC128317982 isoform X2 n=1 Tax=Pangasianodon hypophthalmus TaxID=310915 RepID=UPI00230782E9|nr:uncharacterized protein LOC128317982 isoform X2 [Pangasianodon hypophthalmus]XP_053088222.1 uncharacterized protein LOC128317982 isoform X2 [Pangasianodon hypophthalmus]
MCCAYSSLPSAGVSMKTLEEIDQLEQSRFGRPHPRHGLKLLYWFANDCLSFNQNNVMLSHCYPENGNFGFHSFENKYERYSGKLLPKVAFPYYEVGNLRKPGANDLPHYVRKDYTRFPDNSNMDRIIVSLNNHCIERVYVTEHSDRSNFNKHSTYHISKHLIMIIRGLTLEDFLLKTGYLKQQTNSFLTSLVELSNQQPPCPAPLTLSIFSPAITSSTTQDIQKEIESLSILIKNNTQGHQEASPIPSIFSPAITSSTTQDIQKEIESLSILIKNNTQGHQEASPTRSIFSPAITSSTTQDIQKEIESLSILIKNNIQGHQEASPTPSICSPAITFSTNQDICTDIESPPIFTNNNNTQMRTTTKESELQLNDFIPDNTMQSFRNFNLQTPSKDIQTSKQLSKRTPTIASSRNQKTDIKSPVSKMSFFFWGVYFLLLFFFFYFFWEFIMRIFIIVIFLSSLFQEQNRKNDNFIPRRKKRN